MLQIEQSIREEQLMHSSKVQSWHTSVNGLI